MGPVIVVICRGCLSHVDKKETHDFGLKEIRDLFRECTTIEVPLQEEEGTPFQICEDCFLKCEQFVYFKKMCLAVNARFQQNCGGEMAIEIISSDEEDFDNETLSFGELLQTDEEKDQDIEVNEEYTNLNGTSSDNSKGNWTMCTLCDKPFVTLWAHIIRVHYNKSTQNCPLCKDAVSGRPELEKHIRKHTKEPEPVDHSNYDCPVCGLRIHSRCNFLRHTVTHTNEVPFICKICKTEVKRIDAIRYHIQKLHSVHWEGMYTIKSDTIYAKFESGNMSMDEFAEAVKGIKDQQTSDGDDSDDDADSRESAENSKTLMKCNFCKIETTSLWFHIYKCHLKNPSECPLCKTTLTTPRSIAAHLRTHTGEPAQDLKHPCPLCPLKFGKALDLFSHSVVHTHEKPFVCKICSNDYKHASAIRKHLKADHDGSQMDMSTIKPNTVYAKLLNNEISMDDLSGVISERKRRRTK